MGMSIKSGLIFDVPLADSLLTGVALSSMSAGLVAQCLLEHGGAAVANMQETTDKQFPFNKAQGEASGEIQCKPMLTISEWEKPVSGDGSGPFLTRINVSHIRRSIWAVAKMGRRASISKAEVTVH